MKIRNVEVFQLATVRTCYLQRTWATTVISLISSWTMWIFCMLSSWIGERSFCIRRPIKLGEGGRWPPCVLNARALSLIFFPNRCSARKAPRTH